MHCLFAFRVYICSIGLLGFRVFCYSIRLFVEFQSVLLKDETVFWFVGFQSILLQHETVGFQSILLQHETVGFQSILL